MSFILDALKKSELERQRQTLPGLVEAGGTRAKGRLPVWAVALGALLCVNLLVLAFLLTRHAVSREPAMGSDASRQASPAPVAATTTPDPSAAASPPESAAQPASLDRPRAPGPAAAFSPMDATADYAPEIPVTGSGTSAAAAPDAVTGSAESEPARTRHATRHQDPVLTQQQDYRPVDEEVLPTINEVSLTGAQALPELHLDVHVFATRPSERFVYINMRKYHEGATLQEGPVIERIRRDGVVLRWQDLRFLLPRR